LPSAQLQFALVALNVYVVLAAITWPSSPCLPPHGHELATASIASHPINCTVQISLADVLVVAPHVLHQQKLENNERLPMGTASLLESTDMRVFSDGGLQVLHEIIRWDGQNAGP